MLAPLNAPGPRSPPCRRGGAARGGDSAQVATAPTAEADQPRRAGHARCAGTARPGGPPFVVAVLVAGRAGPTWDRQFPAPCDRQRFARRTDSPAPGQAGRKPPLPRDAGGSGQRRTPAAHRRRCASALSTRQAAGGDPAPAGDATFGAFRTRGPPGNAHTPPAARHVQCSAAKFLRPKCRRTRLRARAAMGGPRVRGSRPSNRPGRGSWRVVVSCSCRAPRRAARTSARGSLERPDRGWADSCRVQMRPRLCRQARRPARGLRARFGRRVAR